MKKLSLNTLLVSLKMKNDYDIRKFAKEQLSMIYGLETVQLIQEILIEEISDSSDVPNDNTASDPMQMSEEDIARNAPLISDISEKAAISLSEAQEFVKEIRQAQKTQSFTIKSIMEMYRTKDSFLVKKAKEYMTIRYEKYIYDIIRKHYSTYSGTQIDDLYQNGVCGLYKAMQTYDESIASFTTYCHWFICHEITAQANFFRGNTTVHFNKIQKKILEVKNRLMEEGYEASSNQIALYTGYRIDIIERELQQIDQSTPVYLGVSNREELPCRYEETPEYLVEEKERNNALIESLKKLMPNLPEIRKVVILKYCLNYTNEQIANELKLTLGQVKSYCQRGLNELRKDSFLARMNEQKLSEAQREMLKHSIPVTFSKEEIEQQMNNTIEIMNSLQMDSAFGGNFEEESSDEPYGLSDLFMTIK